MFSFSFFVMLPVMVNTDEYTGLKIDFFDAAYSLSKKTSLLSCAEMFRF